MKKEFVVERNGRSFVLYAGLLEEAHAQGLKSILTTLLQIPGEENCQVAICQATVQTEKGTFSGLGDAAPDNVARPMATCLIRMAETRAKARALRDAVNVGAVALEELSGDEDEAESPRLHAVAAPMRQAPVTPVVPLVRASGDSSAATAAQVRAIYAIARNQHALSEVQTDERCREQYSLLPSELSKRQASEFITGLQVGESAHQAGS
jgi:hypothetical protein